MAPVNADPVANWLQVPLSTGALLIRTFDVYLSRGDIWTYEQHHTAAANEEARRIEKGQPLLC